jgi:hypothetical protein
MQDHPTGMLRDKSALRNDIAQSHPSARAARCIGTSSVDCPTGSGLSRSILEEYPKGGVFGFTDHHPILVDNDGRRIEMIGQDPVERVVRTLDRAHSDLHRLCSSFHY